MRFVVLEEHGLFTSSDLELQYSGAASGVASGVACPPPLVITDISIGRDAHECKDVNCKLENVGQEIHLDKAGEATRRAGVKSVIGVTATVEFIGDRAL